MALVYNIAVHCTFQSWSHSSLHFVYNINGVHFTWFIYSVGIKIQIIQYWVRQCKVTGLPLPPAHQTLPPPLPPWWPVPTNQEILCAIPYFYKIPFTNKTYFAIFQIKEKMAIVFAILYIFLFSMRQRKCF